MAVTFKDLEDKTDIVRGSTYDIDPRKMKVKPYLSGRHSNKPIAGLVNSFLTPGIGQITPITVMKDGGSPLIVLGHRRYRTAMWITEHLAELIAAGRCQPIKRIVGNSEVTLDYFPLQCVYFLGTEQEAFWLTIAENRDREAPEPADDAHCVQQLIRWGNSEEVIARRYFPEAATDPKELKKAMKWVRDMVELSGLSEDAEAALREKKIDVPAAVELARVSKDGQAALLSKGDRITAASVRASVKESSPQSDKPKTRKISELKEFWKPYAEREDQAQTKIHKFAAAHLAYIGGGDPDQYFKTVKELLGDK